MNIYEAIFARKSVRNYRMEALAPQVLTDIYKFYESIRGLFSGIPTEISIIENVEGLRHMGIFGRKAPYYLAIYSAEAEKSMMNAGFIMGQMGLYLCMRGLGSCFAGMGNPPRSYRNKNGKKLVILMAFGKAKGTCTRNPQEAKRLDLQALCVIKDTPGQWVQKLLEAARMAPSSYNSQPWRFLVYGSRIHVFAKKEKRGILGKYREFDFGIMFSYIVLAAEEFWVDVDLIRLGNLSQKVFVNSQYILSVIYNK